MMKAQRIPSPSSERRGSLATFLAWRLAGALVLLPALVTVQAAVAQDCPDAPRLIAQEVQCPVAQPCALPLAIDAPDTSGVEAEITSSLALSCVDTAVASDACTGLGFCAVGSDCAIAGAALGGLGSSAAIQVVCEEPGTHEIGFENVRFANTNDLANLVPGCGVGTTLICGEVVTPVCGDATIDDGEQCDGASFGDATCISRGFTGGTLTCTAACEIDDSGCTSSTCGNGAIDTGEQCDGANLAGQTCILRGHDGGTLACSAACTLDESGCTSAGCGNGAIDSGEQCDGSNLAGQDCVSRGFDGGSLACTSTCEVDVSGCTNGTCGNGSIEPGEQCDGTNLAGQNCITRGFDEGTLACSNTCEIDTSGCTNGTCGNGAIDAGEQCDSSSLGGRTCSSEGFGGGTLSCTNACEVDTSGCTSGLCGNGIINAGEQCDSASLMGQSCISRGFASGYLACSNTCEYDVSGCTMCGNGSIDAGEQCDRLNLGDRTCTSEGFAGGSLDCTLGCRLDTSGCEDSLCGNGTIDDGEDCDGSNLDDESCLSRGFPGGELGCTSTCRFDASGCNPELCGNGVIDGVEECDGNDHGDRTCATFGFDGGSLICTVNCGIDTSACTVELCGDGVVTAPEQCDGTNLADETCVSRGFDGGALGCTTECGFDDSGCTVDLCGNGAVDDLEDCDGVDLAGESCESRGFDGGDLSCTAGCSFSESACVIDECGNGVLDGDEECDDGNSYDGDFCSSECFITTCLLSVCPAGKVCNRGTGRCEIPACEAAPRLIGPMPGVDSCLLGTECSVPILMEGSAAGVAAATATVVVGSGIECGSSCGQGADGVGSCSLDPDCSFTFSSLGSPVGAGEIVEIADLTVVCSEVGTHPIRFDDVQLGTLAGVPIPGACGTPGEIRCVGCADVFDCPIVDFCVSPSSCVDGVCAYEPVTCDDGLQCTIDSCGAEGCTSTAAPSGDACDDADPCTVGDACGTTGCAGTPRQCPLGEVCNSASGQCGAAQSSSDMVCFNAAGDSTAVFFGNMRTSSHFAGGTDADLLGDSLGPNMLFANTPIQALRGGSTDRVKYTVNLPESGTWYAWGRFYYPGSGPNDGNSFFFQLDGGLERSFGNNKEGFQRFHWDGDGLREYGPFAPLSLGHVSAGVHAIVIGKREVLPAGSQPRLDTVCLRRDDATPPADSGVRLSLGMVECDFDADCDDDDACTVNSCINGVCAEDRVECAEGVCDAVTGCGGSTLVCIRAAGDPTAEFRNDMKSNDAFTAGIDSDPDMDSLNSELVFPDSDWNAFPGNSGDEVQYSIELPMSGRWYLWSRLYYPGVRRNEANSFYLQIDRGDLRILGNNNDFFRRWHWDGDGRLPDGEQGPPIPLDLGVLGAGSHEILIKKREARPPGRQPRLDILCLRNGDPRPPTDKEACLAGGCDQ